jgi:23S rRNA (adenine1618-N6)-methyltransferase
MSTTKKVIPVEKVELHPRNKHRDKYDFKKLTELCPGLSKYLQINKVGAESIDFANPKAVKWLNKALLMQFYSVQYWDIPSGYLCPPIPGRADYIHNIAELISTSNGGKIPLGGQVKCMDIGVGASCIYPIIAIKEYGWSVVGTDIDKDALESARKIIEHNDFLKKKMELRFQENPNDVLHGVMLRTDPIDVVICNPPFHASQEEAQKGTLKKISSLTRKKAVTPVLNFGGQSNELWCAGGEERFIRNMIRQSRQFSTNCYWFTTLISKKEHVEPILEAIKMEGAVDVRILPMGQGTKISRIVAWSFLNPTQQKKWKETKWNAH